MLVSIMRWGVQQGADRIVLPQEADLIILHPSRLQLVDTSPPELKWRKVTARGPQPRIPSPYRAVPLYECVRHLSLDLRPVQGICVTADARLTWTWSAAATQSGAR